MSLCVSLWVGNNHLDTSIVWNIDKEILRKRKSVWKRERDRESEKESEIGKWREGAWHRYLIG